MNAIHSLVEQSGDESRPSEPGHPRDQAIALAVDRCRPLVIRSSATPGGDVIAAAIDACASGRTVYTTTNGEGLLRMAPALFRASHLGLPIVMTVASPSGASDHGHAMALRDCGWVQLYPSDDQDAVDTHIQAFRIAESLSLPVMVCTDTFTGAHSIDRPLAPSAEEINTFLEGGDWPPPARSISASETSDMQLEMRYLTHTKQGLALETIRQVGADFRAHFGRRSGGVLTTHRLYAAELAVLGLGSTFEAITAAVDELRGHGMSVGALGLLFPAGPDSGCRRRAPALRTCRDRGTGLRRRNRRNRPDRRPGRAGPPAYSDAHRDRRPRRPGYLAGEPATRAVQGVTRKHEQLLFLTSNASRIEIFKNVVTGVDEREGGAQGRRGL